MLRQISMRLWFGNILTNISFRNVGFCVDFITDQWRQLKKLQHVTQPAEVFKLKSMHANVCLCERLFNSRWTCVCAHYRCICLYLLVDSQLQHAWINIAHKFWTHAHWLCWPLSASIFWQTTAYSLFCQHFQLNIPQLFLFFPLRHTRFLCDYKHPLTQFGPSLPKCPTPGSLILDINVFFVCLFISCIYFCVWVGVRVSWRPLYNIPPLLCSGFPNLWQRDRSWLRGLYWWYCS